MEMIICGGNVVPRQRKKHSCDHNILFDPSTTLQQLLLCAPAATLKQLDTCLAQQHVLECRLGFTVIQGSILLKCLKEVGICSLVVFLLCSTSRTRIGNVL
jgi:hypothetical protein